MRIAFLTDLHLTEFRGKLSDDQAMTLERAVDIVEDFRPDLVLLGGDNSGYGVPHKSTLVERNAHVDLRIRLAKLAPVVEIMGNHDYPGDYDVFNKLATDHAMTFVSEPCSVEIDSCTVWCFPWVFASSAPEGVSHADHVRALYEDFVVYATAGGNDRLNVLLAHGAVQDALVKLGQPPVPTSDPVMRSEEWMPTVADDEGDESQLFDAGFFGHYHDHQVVRFNEDSRPIGYYGGSLTVSQFGESPKKGVLLWDSSRRREPDGGFTFKQTRPQPRVIADLDPTTGEIRWSGGKPAGARVRLRVGMPPDGGDYALEIEDVRAALGDAGAAAVEVQIVDPDVDLRRDGAEDIATETNDDEKLYTYLTRVREPQMTEAEAKVVVAMFEEIRAQERSDG